MRISVLHCLQTVVHALLCKVHQLVVYLFFSMGFFDFLVFESRSKGILYPLWLHFGGIIPVLSQLLFHVGILKLPQSMCNDQNLSQTTQQSKCQERQLSSFEESRNVV